MSVSLAWLAAVSGTAPASPASPPLTVSFSFEASSSAGWSTPSAAGSYASTRRSGGTPSGGTGPASALDG
eukprot:4873014-Prymnesium_polylepis.1